VRHTICTVCYACKARFSRRFWMQFGDLEGKSLSGCIFVEKNGAACKSHQTGPSLLSSFDNQRTSCKNKSIAIDWRNVDRTTIVWHLDYLCIDNARTSGAADWGYVFIQTPVPRSSPDIIIIFIVIILCVCH